jgi:adenosylhomocysteine nucleosidase
MRLVIVCGMPQEAAVLAAALPGVLILSGAAKNNLAALVPADTTHIASAGLGGGLSPNLRIADADVAGLLVDGSGRRWTPDPVWSKAILNAISTITVRAAGDNLETPIWAQRAVLCPWYSSGILDQADTALQRAALFAQTGAQAIDDESFYVAEFAARHDLRFAIMRSVSDDASETLPLAARGAIMNADGSANIEYLLQEIVKEPAYQTLDLAKIMTDFNASLASLQAAAPALLEALN